MSIKGISEIIKSYKLKNKLKWNQFASQIGVAERTLKIIVETDEIKTLVKEQNGRVRALESSVSRIQGVGSMFVVVFGSLISWLFKGE